MGGGGGGCWAAAMLPADRRRRSMEVIPKPADGFMLFGVITTVRRLGEGGRGVFEGDVSRISVLTWMCDCDEFLGLPRRKEPKIVVLVGGDSLPAWGWPSIQFSSPSQTMRQIVVESKGTNGKSRLLSGTPCPSHMLIFYSILSALFYIINARRSPVVFYVH